MRTLALYGSIFVGFQTCVETPPVPPPKPVLLKDGLDVEMRDRCLAAHPREAPLQIRSWHGPMLADVDEVARWCRAMMATPYRNDGSIQDIPRFGPTAAEAEALCTPSSWMSVDAALCIAEEARLPKGIEPPVAHLRVDEDLQAVVWEVQSVWTRFSDGWSADVFRIDAVDGTLRSAGGHTVIVD